MIFASPVFLQLFLPLLFLLYYGIFRRLSWKNHLLLAASLLFYVWGEPELCIVLLISIAVNYILACVWLRPEKSRKTRLIAVTVGILLNLGVLVGFKYTVPILIFLDQIFHFPFQTPDYRLPLGISFYTFQIISYLIDTYRGENEPQRNPEKLALFISFFPQLIAGPIIKYHDISKELSERKSTLNDCAIGIRRFVLGLSKKVLLANMLAVPADDIFSMPIDRMDTSVAWIGAICYSLQIYFDFSGYSDMAIGLGRMFGFHFGENFNYPYQSGSIQEFWRRWHISLSTWFKEYLYIPLKGNRCSTSRWAMNIMIVFLVTGIWHGAAWNFILWGILYGIFIVLEKLFLAKYLEKPYMRAVSHLYTLLIVIFAWVLFRADSVEDAFRYWQKMVCFCSNPALSLSDFFQPLFYAVLVIGIIFCAPLNVLFPGMTRHFREECVHPAEIPVLLFLLLLVILLLSGNTYNPFIYFRF